MCEGELALKEKEGQKTEKKKNIKNERYQPKCHMEKLFIDLDMAVRWVMHFHRRAKREWEIAEGWECSRKTVLSSSEI